MALLDPLVDSGSDRFILFPIKYPLVKSKATSSCASTLSDIWSADLVQVQAGRSVILDCRRDSSSGRHISVEERTQWPREKVYIPDSGILRYSGWNRFGKPCIEVCFRDDDTRNPLFLCAADGYVSKHLYMAMYMHICIVRGQRTKHNLIYAHEGKIFTLKPTPQYWKRWYRTIQNVLHSSEPLKPFHRLPERQNGHWSGSKTTPPHSVPG